MELNIEQLAYIAGFFDGEGSAFISYPKARNGKRYKKHVAKLAQKNPEVLIWIKDLVGFGTISHCKDLRGDGMGCWYWSTSYNNARIFLSAIRPYTIVKSETIDNVLNL